MARPRGVRRLFHHRFRKGWAEDVVDSEIRHHLELRTDELIEDGHHPDDAARLAEEAFGNIGRYRAQCVVEERREARMTGWKKLAAGIAMDVRYALRGMKKSPGFAIAVVLTLGIGIGANTAIFTVVHSLLLKPIPFHEPDELYGISVSFNGGSLRFTGFSSDYAERWQKDVFLGHPLRLHASVQLLLTQDGEPRPLEAHALEPGLTDLLGVAPLLGRPFNPDDAVPGAVPVALVSESFWSREMGGDVAMVGRSITLDDVPHTVIGVMPRSFRFPVVSRSDVWVPLADDGTAIGEINTIEPIVRIPLDDLEPTRARTEAFAVGIQEGFEQFTPGLIPLNEPDLSQQNSQKLWVVFGAVGLMFLIALVNCVNLMLARATTRVREIGVRLAIGGGRTRVVGHLLTESLLLGLMSGVAAVGLALLGVEALLDLAPTDLGFFASRTIEVDRRVLVFAGGLSVATGLILGLLPGLGVIRAASATSGSALGSYGSRTRRGHRLRGALVVSQVSLSLVVLFGAGLLGRSFSRLVSVDPGFDPEGLAAVSLRLSEARYPTAEARAAVVGRFAERLRSVPGIVALSTSDRLPPSDGFTFGQSLWVDGDAEPIQEGSSILLPMLSGDAELRPTLGMRLVSGRDFDVMMDPSETSVLVTESLSRRLSRGGDATGLRFRMRTLGFDGDWWTVVGVVENLKLTEFGSWADGLITLLPRDRHGTPVAFAARVAGDPNTVLPAMRKAIREVDPSQPVAELRTFDEALWESVSRPWFFLVLMGIFAALALLLASLGLYGVLAFSVAQRRREMGIRVALGARAQSVRSLVLGEGLRLAAIGTALGVGTSLWASPTLDGLLFETSPTDVLTLVLVGATMMAVAAVASYVPATHATRVDPMEVLRVE